MCYPKFVRSLLVLIAAVSLPSVSEAASILSGYVYIDSNNDGKLAFAGSADPEYVIPNVEIRLYQANAAELAAGVPGALQAVAYTDAQGRYQFTGLAAGEYLLRQVQPIEFLDGIETVGSIAGIDAPLTPEQFAVGLAVENGFDGIELPSSARGSMYNFGELGLSAQFASKRFLLGFAVPATMAVPEPTALSGLLCCVVGGVGTMRRRRGSR